MWATQHVDEVIDIVRNSQHAGDCLGALDALGFNALQAHMILDVPLRRLAPRNVTALQAAIDELNSVTDEQLADASRANELGQVRWEP